MKIKKIDNRKTISEILEFNSECQRLMSSEDVKNASLRFELFQSLAETSLIQKNFNNSRVPILEKYGKKEKEGNYSITNENMDAFTKELEPLLIKKITLNIFLSKKLIMELESNIPNKIYGFLK